MPLPLLAAIPAAAAATSGVVAGGLAAGTAAAAAAKIAAAAAAAAAAAKAAAAAAAVGGAVKGGALAAAAPAAAKGGALAAAAPAAKGLAAAPGLVPAAPGAASAAAPAAQAPIPAMQMIAEGGQVPNMALGGQMAPVEGGQLFGSTEMLGNVPSQPLPMSNIAQAPGGAPPAGVSTTTTPAGIKPESMISQVGSGTSRPAGQQESAIPQAIGRDAAGEQGWLNKFLIGEDAMARMTPGQIKRAKMIGIINMIAGMKQGGIAGGVSQGMGSAQQYGIGAGQGLRGDRFRGYLEDELGVAQEKGDPRRIAELQSAIAGRTSGVPAQKRLDTVWGKTGKDVQGLFQIDRDDPTRAPVRIPGLERDRPRTLDDIYGEGGRVTRTMAAGDEEIQTAYESVTARFADNDRAARSYYRRKGAGQKELALARKAYKGTFPGAVGQRERARQIDALMARPRPKPTTKRTPETDAQITRDLDIY